MKGYVSGMSFAHVGFEMVIPIGAGIWIDSQYGTTPWCTLGGVALGFFGGLYHLILLAKQANRQDSDDKNKLTKPDGSANG